MYVSSKYAFLNHFAKIFLFYLRQRLARQGKSRMTLLLIHLSVADLIVILFQVLICWLVTQLDDLFHCYLDSRNDHNPDIREI